MALSVFYRAIKSRITDLAQRSKLVIGQGIMQTDADNRALVIPTGLTTVMTFLPIEDQCIFAYQLENPQAIPSATETRLQIAQALIPSAHYDAAAYEFIAPAPGVYEFFGGVGSQDTTSQSKILSLYVNAALFRRLSFGTYASITRGAYSSGPVPLSAGDAVALYVSFGAAHDADAVHTWFSGRRIA